VLCINSMNDYWAFRMLTKNEQHDGKDLLLILVEKTLEYCFQRLYSVKKKVNLVNADLKIYLIDNPTISMNNNSTLSKIWIPFERKFEINTKLNSDLIILELDKKKVFSFVKTNFQIHEKYLEVPLLCPFDVEFNDSEITFEINTDVIFNPFFTFSIEQQPFGAASFLVKFVIAFLCQENHVECLGDLGLSKNETFELVHQILKNLGAVGLENVNYSKTFEDCFTKKNDFSNEICFAQNTFHFKTLDLLKSQCGLNYYGAIPLTIEHFTNENNVESKNSFLNFVEEKKQNVFDKKNHWYNSIYQTRIKEIYQKLTE
jgi:hypothetical protein